MIRALVVTLDLALLVLMGADLSHGLTLLTATGRGLAAAAALLAIWPYSRFGRRTTAFSGGPAAVLGLAIAAAAGLAGIEEVASRRMLRDWEAGAVDRLQARAEVLHSDFAWLLSEITRPFETRIADSDDARTAFHILHSAHDATHLPPDRYGLALYRADGQLLAWAGNSTAAPKEILAARGPGTSFLVAGTEEMPRLFATTIDALTGLRRVAELVIKSPSTAQGGAERSEVQLDFLPHWNAIEPARPHVAPGPVGEDDLAAIDAVQGERRVWRMGRLKVLAMTVPLRVPGGLEILSADLFDRRGQQELASRRDVVVRIAAALLAGALVAATALVMRGARWPAWARLLAASSAVWGVRLFLLLTGPRDAVAPSSLYDSTTYASSDLGGLLVSPADLLLTCGAILAQAWLVRRFLDHLRLPESPSRLAAMRVLALVTAAGAAVAIGFGLHAAIDHQVLEARIDISRVDLDQDMLPRLALQAGLFLVVAAGATLVTALVRLARRPPGEPGGAIDAEAAGGPPAVIRGVGTILLLTALYVPLVLHAYGMLRRDFFENDLSWRVLHQREQRRDALRDALRETADEEWLQTTGFEEDPGSPGGLAYRLWSRTPLATMGLASSLRIYDDDTGRIVSRFGVNLGIMFEPPFWRVKEAADGDVVTLPPQAGITLRKAVVFGSRRVQPVGQPPLLVTFTVVDDYDNVALLGAESSYLPLLRARALSRTNPELLAFEPLMAVFNTRLERLYESGGEIPAPTPAIAAAISRRGQAWARDDIGEGPARILYFRGPEEIFALAQPSPDLMRLLAVFLRLALLNSALYFLAVLAARAGAAIGGQAMPPLLPGRSFYARLTTVFVIGAMAPLLMLSMFVSRFSARESRRELVASGLSSLQTVRRVAEDYLSLADPGYGPSLDEEVVFFLSRVVRQDISVYKGFDLLASSTPELYSSSLLNNRLDGGIFRALYLDREPFQLERSQVGDMDYLTLSAPMRIDREGSLGVVSIPLAAQSRALAVRSEELADAIMIASCLTVALLAVFGWIVARRVSGPIISLAGASRRVAAGDLDVRVGSAPPDEVGVLVNAFNSMAESLQQQRHDLDRRREYIETILTRATTGVVSIDARGIVITINPAAQQLLGPGSQGPQPGDDLGEWLERSETLAPLRRAFERSMEDDVEGEVSLDLGPGEEARRVRAVFLPFTPEEGRPPGRIVLLEDVTDIVRSGRLAAWAEMTRRIAHEIKNPLTPIQLSVEHVRRVWQAGDARFGVVLKECLDNIQGQVRALRQIASEFSAYARVPEIRTEATTVDQLFDAALDPYVAAPPPGIAITRSAPPGLPSVVVDRAVMARALVNLIENAIQAMPQGGTLALAAVLEGAHHPPRLRLTVRDSGTGVAPDILARIFEPYFSTKSGGTGLGLAIARRAVEEHGGTIDIRSRPGQGTVVTLVLPAAS